MRLEELRLIAYGPFTDCTLRLKPGLNVLYGPNEAGKSSALRAVHALLFGIEERTDDNFVHSYPQLRVGGLLVDSQGGCLACVRRKGRRSTLRDGDDDQPLDEAELRAMLGGVSVELFATVFGIDHERLREGGDEVVRGEGHVGELLFAAGGVSHLREKQQSLENVAADLFKPSGRNPQINSALTELRELSDQIRKLQQSPEEWARHDAEYRRLVGLAEQVRQELTVAESTKSRLDRYFKALGFVGAWRERKSDLAALTDVVVLPDDAEQRFRDANEKRKLAAVTKVKAEGRANELQAELEKLDVPTTLLSEETRIDELYRRLGSHEKAATDRGVLAGQQRTALSSAKRTIEKLGWEVEVDDASERRVADEKKARVRALASRHGEVTQGKTRQQQVLDRLRKKLAELKEQVAGAAELADPVAIRNAVAAAAAAVELEDSLAEQQVEVDRLTREADAALDRLPLWKGSLEEVCRLETPVEETVDEFDQTSRDLASERKKFAERQEAVRSERDEVARDLEALERAESVPTEEELAGRRAVRDRGVRLAAQRLGGEEVDADAVDAFVKEVAAGDDLASALEPSVREADEVADRLRREASRVAEKFQQVAQLHKLDSEAERLNEKLADIEQQQNHWEAEWKQRWVASGVNPATPAEMRGWLRKHSELVNLSGLLASANDRLSKDENQVLELRKSLADALSQESVEFSDDATLQQLVEAGQDCVDQRAECRRRRDELDSEVARVGGEITQAEEDLAAAEAELAQWRDDWAEAVRPLELEVDALPEQVEAVLANLDELFRNLDDAEGYRTRIWGIDKTAAEFAEAAREMAQQVAPDLADSLVEELVSTLNRLLSDAKRVRQQAESLQGQLDSEQEAIAEADEELSAAAAVLEALVTEAACGDVGDLPAAIEKSRQKQSLEADVLQRESQLVPLCAGQPLSEFVMDVEREDADQLPIRIEELANQIKSLRYTLEETIAAREREAGVLERYDGSAEAAEKAEERQSILARMEDDVREYVVATVAGRLLQRAVERYQEKSQGPVLAGASDRFRALTCGSFEGLRTDYDESGQEVLVGLRPDGSLLPVSAMSDGAGDQLYLSLRLGTLDHWLEGHEPTPLIVDDVLLSFDDQRAEATMKLLLELSARTQVLFFTHHRHLVTLAEKVAASNGSAASLHVVDGICDRNKSI